MKDVLALICGDSVAEIRIPKSKQGVVSGYFNDWAKAELQVKPYNGKVPGIYVTLNPVPATALARANNRLLTRASVTTSDADIERRRWLPIDVDPVRMSGISSTDEQHEEALKASRRIVAFLSRYGWPQPILADSGNGGHLLYRIDLPNDTYHSDLLKTVLEALSFKFSNNVIGVDTQVYNAARIWKLYGTKACKGENTSECPHRISKLLSVPDGIDNGKHLLPEDVLEHFARSYLKKYPKPERKLPDGTIFDVPGWLHQQGIAVSKEKDSWKPNEYLWELAHCPFDESHQHSSFVLQNQVSGAISFSCQHNSHRDLAWRDLREKLEPGYNRGYEHPQLRREKRGTEVRQVPKPEFLKWNDEAFMGVLERINSTERFGIGTGFICLDEAIGGLLPGNMITVAARPSLGKSTFVLNICSYQTLRDRLPLFISVEMSRTELEARRIQNITALPTHRILSNNLSDEERDIIRDCAAKLRNRPMLVDDTVRTMDDVKRSVENAMSLPTPPCLVVIDYIQLLKSYSGKMTSNEEVSLISLMIKRDIAQGFSLPVLAVSQLSRNAEYRSDKRPQLSDLRDSGAIEQDSDVVFFIHPQVDLSGCAATNRPNSVDCDIIIGKARNGLRGSYPFVFDLQRGAFLPTDGNELPF